MALAETTPPGQGGVADGPRNRLLSHVERALAVFVGAYVCLCVVVAALVPYHETDALLFGRWPG